MSIFQSFGKPFTKNWILLIGILYYDNLLKGVLDGVLILMIGKIIEPMIGSKEFLRVYIMTGLYTNILMVIFVSVLYLITKYSELLSRPILTGSACQSAISMMLAHQLFPVQLPSMCGPIHIRMLPFMVLVISLIFALFTTFDDFVSTLFGTTLSYVYIRFIKKNGSRRGFPTFSLRKLIPFFSDDSDEDEDDVPRPPRNAAGIGDNFERFQYNPGPQRNTRTERRQNLFQGNPRTVGG